MFLRNAWYVAASDDEVGRQPLRRIILGEPVVLFRTEDGTPVAFEDRCAHRHLPLSMGKLIATRCSATITACATTGPARACGCPGRT
jgi:phenylpropionate dioxygenase-like ring-hydroxylating dioxygenase large terminal subunit